MADGNSFEQTTDQAQLIMNRLFRIGLDLNVVRSHLDEPDRQRLQAAIDALDEAIQDVRALALSRLPR